MKRMSHRLIVASTVGYDAAEIGEYRYQPTRTKDPIYSIGDRYFSVTSGKPPRDEVGDEWRKHDDQFYAEKAGRVIWVCDLKTRRAF